MKGCLLLMTFAVVTFEIDSKQRVDLALPLNVPNQVLAQELVKALELPEPKDFTYLFSVKTEDGIVRLSSNTTLGEAGILDGFVLQLQRQEGAPTVEDTEGKAFLQAESGETFSLNSISTMIGRKDVKRGVMVDVDLAPFDLGKIISRRHAVIELRQDQFAVIDQGSVNGTWLNNERLDPKKAFTLKDGDVLVFGRDGVQMKFNQR